MFGYAAAAAVEAAAAALVVCALLAVGSAAAVAAVGDIGEAEAALAEAAPFFLSRVASSDASINVRPQCSGFNLT